MLSYRYKTGSDRQQTLLFPPSIDEYVSQTNTVRAIDVYVDTLDLVALKFTYTSGGSNLGGAPAYPPAAMLKLYLYGYMNRIRSSRRLEREAQRNIELIWLLQEFKPSHTTIANFRKDNLRAIKRVNRDFIMLCHELGLFGCKEVGIDGTFMNGNASKASIFTKKKLEKQLAKLDKTIENYLTELEQNDHAEHDTSAEDVQLAEKIERMKTSLEKCKARLKKLEENGDTQLSETDPDARFLTKRGQTTAGYNVQTAVDSKNKLIVYHDVVNDGNDSQQLAPMAIKAKETLRAEHLEVNADAGYDNREHIKECVDEGITPYVPLADKDAQARKAGRFVRAEFSFDIETNSYQCPANQVLVQQGIQKKEEKIFWKYASKASTCATCELCKKCLPEKTKYRQIYRWEHEHIIIDEHRQRMKESGREHMKTRASLAEHPFGTMKSDMGWQHFLMRGIDKVCAEMDLQVLSYNFKRVLNIIGISAFKNHLKQRIIAI